MSLVLEPFVSILALVAQLLDKGQNTLLHVRAKKYSKKSCKIRYVLNGSGTRWYDVNLMFLH